MRGHKTLAARPGLLLADEAIHLVRTAGAPTLGLYFIGAFPFIAGLVTFWATMGQSAHADAQLPGAALGVALLFLWMKTWQSRFCQVLLARVREQEPPPWNMGAFWRSLSRQAFIQATGWAFLPVAALMGIPFPWLFALYQNACVLEDGSQRKVREHLRDAAPLAGLWPKQNLILIWLFSLFPLLVALLIFLVLLPIIASIIPPGLSDAVYMPTLLAGVILAFSLVAISPLGLIVSINLASGILICVSLLHSLLGLDTLLMSSPMLLFNSTYLVIVVGLTYMCLDPILKAGYVLRCFYGESVASGEDLRLAFQRKLPVVLCVVALGFSGASMAEAEEEVAPLAVHAQELDSAIDAELSHSRYTWRMPREAIEIDQESWVMGKLRSISEWIEWFVHKIFDAIEWLLERIFGRGASGAENRPGLSTVQAVLRVVLIILSVGLVAALIAVFLRNRRLVDALLADESPSMATVPDLEHEGTTAAALPESGWRALAREQMDKGEYRLAARALFLAMLASLSEGGVIRLGRAKSNRDYAGEVRRRGHVYPELLPLFRGGASVYEAVWYGKHEATELLVRGGLLERLDAIDTGWKKPPPSADKRETS